MTAEDQDRLLEEVRDILEVEGIHGVLRFLNDRTSHRFTGVYRYDPPTLRSVRLFDRENPSLEIGEDAPVRETYCSLIAISGEPYAVEDALQDERIADHPAREQTRAYCGVPVRDEEGKTVATLCHFDISPRRAPTSDILMMQAVAPLILITLRRVGAVPEASETGRNDPRIG